MFIVITLRFFYDIIKYHYYDVIGLQVPIIMIIKHMLKIIDLLHNRLTTYLEKNSNQV